MLETARRSVSTSSQVLDPITSSDREDELAFFLEDHGIADAWDLAPSLVDAGLDLADVEAVAAVLPPKPSRMESAGSPAG